MSELRKNLIEKEDRPLRSTRVIQWRYDDTGHHTVGMRLEGYTTIPCDDELHETRVYEFPDPAWAIKFGWSLVQFGFNAKLKNFKIFKRKKK